jgi:toxin-antitoxin system PIN domain toxin
LALLDVNALVALAWDAHVHHAAIRAWFAGSATNGWATCPVTESGFVRVSSNPKVLANAISVEDARAVLRALRQHEGHRFLHDDVSLADAQIGPLAGYRQVTDAHLIAIARRHNTRLVTFDAAAVSLAAGDEVELLAALG